MRVKVLGIKKFKGEVEGQHHDMCTIFIVMKQDESKGTAKGYVGQDLRYGVSDNYDKFQHLTYPLEADIEIETVANGKGLMKTIVTDFKPVQASK